MCVNPVLLPNGIEVACHKCWQCVRRKIDDWTGRCIAESKTATAVHSVTLTYGRDLHYSAVDHVKAAVLTYSDVQEYLHRWRHFKSDTVPGGFPLRYFIVGEYGATKGRAHWHCLLFWKAAVPDRKLNTNIDDEMWPHGHSYWQAGSPATVRYVTKYIAKEVETEERQYHMGLSKYPPLGDAYFRQLALQYVDQRLAPQDYFYSFDEIRDGKGKLQQFVMQGKTRENFMRYFLRGWQDRYFDHVSTSDVVEAFEDSEALRGSQDEAKRVLAAEKVGMLNLRDTVIKDVFTGSVSKPKTTDLRRWMNPRRLKFSETLNVWMYEFDGSQRPWYWAKNEQGSYQWRAKIGTESPTDIAKAYRETSRGQ